MYEKAHTSLKFIRYYISLMLPYIKGTVDVGTLNYIAVDILVREAKIVILYYFKCGGGANFLEVYNKVFKAMCEFADEVEFG